VAQRKDFQAGKPINLRQNDTAKESKEEAGPGTYQIRFTPSRDVFRQGMDPVLVLRALRRLGNVVETRLHTALLPRLSEMDPESCYLGWTVRLQTESTEEEIRDVFAFVEDGAEIAIEREESGAEAEGAAEGAAVESGALRQAKAAAQTSTSIRVATEKVDRLIDLVGELVIAHSMAAEILNDFSMSRLAQLHDAFAGMDQYTRELQERVMAIRMLPIGTVFSRFPRLVRDLASATGKRIALELRGEEIELDKMVVERMSDPLTHLIRNAIDHGIETPEERAAKGKPEQATIVLRAYHQGGNVIVEVGEDGRGLDTARIRAKAVERGLIGENEELNEREVHALVFRPGFSTAEAVSDLSGRGVGMDVVKREVEGLNGAVTLESHEGRGTCVRIKLPLTLAILDGLLLKVGGETYVLPLIQILESIRPSREQLNTMAGRGEVVVVRGEPVPLLRLHRMFGVATEVTDPSRGLVVLVEHHGRRMALLVDELLGQQQVVIKSLETHFRRVEGIAGATILGDGQAALILDVAGLAPLAQRIAA
jgi:two-component system chemotaxis sensor kinase CheA